jgi:hypothetical protein
MGRKLSINGSFYVGMSDAEKYTELSRVVDIVERQRAALEIEVMEFNKKQQIKQLEDQADNLAQLHQKLSDSKGRDKEPNLKAQLAGATKAKDQLVASLKEGEDEIQRKRKFVQTGVRA